MPSPKPLRKTKAASRIQTFRQSRSILDVRECQLSGTKKQVSNSSKIDHLIRVYDIERKKVVTLEDLEL